MLSVRTVMDSTAEVAYVLMVIVSLPLSIFSFYLSLSLSLSLSPPFSLYLILFPSLQHSMSCMATPMWRSVPNVVVNISEISECGLQNESTLT